MGEALGQRERYPGRVCPEEALALAVGALLDSTDPESLHEVSETIGMARCGARCYFNRQSSMLGLVADSKSVLSSQLLPQPPISESVEHNWVFFLSVPDLGEHGYWAIVSRDRARVVTVGRN